MSADKQDKSRPKTGAQAQRSGAQAGHGAEHQAPHEAPHVAPRAPEVVTEAHVAHEVVHEEGEAHVTHVAPVHRSGSEGHGRRAVDAGAAQAAQAEAAAPAPVSLQLAPDAPWPQHEDLALLRRVMGDVGGLGEEVARRLEIRGEPGGRLARVRTALEEAWARAREGELELLGEGAPAASGEEAAGR